MRGMTRLRAKLVVLTIGLAAVSGGLLSMPATATATTPGAEPFIVGGGFVNQQLPWIAALHRNGGFNCTSSIISRRWVLTAAHCVQGGGSYSVRVGSLKRSSGGVVANVTRKVIHPNFRWPNADIALLELDRDVNTTYIKLATSADLNNGKAATIYGWGSQKADWSGPLPENLKYGSGTLAQVSCTRFSVSPPVVCTRTDGSSAGGDSGGPAVVKNANGEPLHVGVNAISTRPSGDGWSGFTSTALFRNWIRSTTGV